MYTHHIRIITLAGSLLILQRYAGAQTAADSAAAKPVTEKIDATITSSVSAGHYVSNSNGAEVNYSKGKLLLYGTYNRNHLKTDSRYTTTRQLISNGQQLVMNDQETDLRNRHIQTFQAGTAYRLSSRSLLAAQVNGYLLNRSRTYNGYTALHTGNADTLINQRTYGTASIHDIAYNVLYRYTIDSLGQELQVQYFRDHFKQEDEDDFNYTWQLPTPFTQQLKQTLPGQLDVNKLKLDYTRNALKGQLVTTIGYNEARYNYAETFTNNSGDKWNIDSAMSGHNMYSEKITTATETYNRTYKQLAFTGGLGIEASSLNVTDVFKAGTKKQRLFYWLPFASANYTISQKQALYFSYGITANRPSYYELTPFRLYIDKYTYRAGNPYLTPSLYTNYSVTHTYNQVFYTTLNYTHVQDIKFMIQRQDNDTKVLENQFVNNGNLAIATLDFTYNKALYKWWVMASSAGTYYTAYKGGWAGAGYNNHALTVYLENTNVFVLGKATSLQLHNSYRSSTVYGLNSSSGVYYLDISAKRAVAKGRVSVSLDVKDLFNSKASYNHVLYQGVDFKYNYRPETRFVALAIALKLGKNRVEKTVPEFLADDRITHN